jgi:hypothetical protein
MLFGIRATGGITSVFKFKIYQVLPVLFVLLFGGVQFAHAQGADVFFGLGSATDKSTGQLIDTFGDGNLYPAPALGGTFGTFGADFMFKPTLGVGGEYSFRFTQGPYAGLNYRPKLYDFNAIWMPLSISKKIAPEFQAGIGGATLSFYYPAQCDQFACSSSTYLESSTHFQAHLSAGLRIYVKGGIYIKPQIDGHYVHNLYQFGSDWVPEYTVSVGYTFGRQ